MAKDYYLILGIPSDATLDDIKDAYRRLAKEFHPDHYGDDHSPFLAVQEAYAILSDPIKRQTHDLEVLGQKKKRGPRYGEGMRSGSPVEPLIPDQEQPVDLGTASLHAYRPLFDRIFSNFKQKSRPESRHLENLNVVITLTPEQAFRGGHIKVALPAQLTCPSCSGKGWVGGYECWRCRGDGILSGDYPVMLSYPPGVSDNHLVRMSLDRYGIGNLYLTVHFRISDLL